MNNKNYRVMKFFEPVNKKDIARGYVRLDIRGIKGNVIVSVENLGDAKTTSEVYLYKDKTNKIKLGDINNKKGMLKKILTFGSNNAIEDYNTCAIVKNGKIALYSNLFNTTSIETINKLDAGEKELTIVPDSKEQDKKEVSVPPEVVEQPENEEPKLSSPVQDVPRRIEKIVTVEERHDEEENIEEFQESEKQEIDVDVTKSSQEFSQEDENSVKSESIRHKNKFNESLYNALKDYKRTEPLSVKIKNFSWWYIPYDEMGIKNGFLPYYNQIVSSYYPYPMSNRVTTCNSLMKKYGHYIFGIYEDNDDIIKFIYGIPGEFTKEEQPYKGITGFKNWSYSNKDNNTEHGYWLAFVNPRTGESTDPPQIVLTK
ncbi:MAG: hypothetical protein VB128_02005 [Sedimentibacter saalensis]|uniref:hypothetical protein n=1 Tax=Sedimentibacter saalensis TaxID=130788 RepID=UPI002B1EBDD3|nr:hypothetical protein [Sedimentibacter saalensis]MEA5093705.1 hypothetical protein [Sedimentibacter saalensis]